MPRMLVAVVLTALLLLAAAGGAVAGETTGSGRFISVSGRVEYVTDYGVPHYEVNGYVLLGDGGARLAGLKGQEVVVAGQEVSQPSLFMRRLLQVQRIEVRTSAPSPSGDSPGLITTPVTPDPGFATPPHAGQTVAIPPIPFFGTQLYVLFGRLETADGRYFMVEPRPDGDNRSWVTSDAVPLATLVGKPLGAVGDREILSDGTVRYHLHSVLVLSSDQADSIRAGTGIIYLPPKGDVTVRLRGRIVNLDQAPVIGNGRTLVGLRAIAEAMGARVEWDPKTMSATISLNDRQIVVTVGSSVIILRRVGASGSMVHTDISPIIVGGRIQVPARVLSEALGLTVRWDEKLRTVNLE